MIGRTEGHGAFAVTDAGPSIAEIAKTFESPQVAGGEIGQETGIARRAAGNGFPAVLNAGIKVGEVSVEPEPGLVGESQVRQVHGAVGRVLRHGYRPLRTVDGGRDVGRRAGAL